MSDCRNAAARVASPQMPTIRSTKTTSMTRHLRLSERKNLAMNASADQPGAELKVQRAAAIHARAFRLMQEFQKLLLISACVASRRPISAPAWRAEQAPSSGAR